MADKDRQDATNGSVDASVHARRRENQQRFVERRKVRFKILDALMPLLIQPHPALASSSCQPYQAVDLKYCARQAKVQGLEAKVEELQQELQVGCNCSPAQAAQGAR